MSRKMVDHLRARGLRVSANRLIDLIHLFFQVFFWVCNKEEDFDRAFAMGRVAVVTDYPSELLKYLQNHSEIERPSMSS